MKLDTTDLNPSPSKIVELERFFCIDVDRTILKTTTLFNSYIEPALQAFARQQSQNEQQLSQRQQIISTLVRDLNENVGKSFDFLAAYDERVSASDRLSIDQLAERVVTMMKQDEEAKRRAVEDEILADGTLDLLAKIDQLPDSGWGFLTSGGIQTQGLKLRILEHLLARKHQLAFRAKILSTEHKTRDIDSIWRHPEGYFVIPQDLSDDTEVRAKRVMVIDDKPRNLLADDMTNIATILVEQLDMADDGLDRLPLRSLIERVNDIDK